jgi:hypothetical protein
MIIIVILCTYQYNSHRRMWAKGGLLGWRDQYQLNVSKIPHLGTE